jgi:WD40 repeat protein
MLRRWTTGRPLVPNRGTGELSETGSAVRLSLLPARIPLLLIVTLCAVCYLTRPDAERPQASERAVLEAPARIVTMAVAPEGSAVATCDAAGMVHLWYPEVGRTQVVPGPPAHATCVAFAPGGAILAVGDVKSSVSIWDVSSGEMKWNVAEHQGGLRTLAFSPDGSTMASGGGNGHVSLWDMATHRLKARLTGHTGAVTTVAFAPDGQSLVTGGQDGTIRCWHAVTSQARWLIPPRPGKTNPTALCARFSPDGKIVATAANYDPPVRVWDSATGRELGTLLGSADMITSLAFTTEGEWLVTGDCRGGLTLWDVESRRACQSWNGHSGWISSVAFFGNGQTLASAGGSTVKLWQLSENGMVRQGTLCSSGQP